MNDLAHFILALTANGRAAFSLLPTKHFSSTYLGLTLTAAGQEALCISADHHSELFSSRLTLSKAPERWLRWYSRKRPTFALSGRQRRSLLRLKQQTAPPLAVRSNAGLGLSMDTSFHRVLEICNALNMGKLFFGQHLQLCFFNPALTQQPTKNKN